MWYNIENVGYGVVVEPSLMGTARLEHHGHIFGEV